ncbi:Glycine cleavage system T protein (aminomethyltransferase) [Halanaeroarchaeum sp. HSR-CO]|uniref:glycine cleavage system aminomethyltransferase GcvT n=1 Tax=Halanaeroarchaeum sp. HSR-CO TaxID=2866382 RepID=UPI00217EF095|nr:glycine cleavage system aminomethyltransferase GcvT [Halanaeroarchaeum sp. HSR-CO]UWG48564.1 Glycine cleavage system T protein (aminomethyltransferase) [Halanaeroarchaeum sp. HSR-CO]
MALRTPPLHDRHEALDASFTDFGGWEMPVEFDSIRAEHEAVRTAAGIFDVSHMGEITVSGPDAERLTQRLTTNDVTALGPGDAQYSMITDERGVILDDTVVYRMPETAPSADAPGSDATFLFVPNAGHDAQMHERWTSHAEQWGLTADVVNVTDDYGMVAVQGPDATAMVAEATDADVLDLGRFEATYGTIAGASTWIARTGYTGEGGFELIFPADDAEAVWDAFDCQACGLGARDTLRMEMGFLLSGQDFDPTDQPRTPYEARVGFTVKLDTEFVGRDALEQQAEEGVDEKFVGFTLNERGVPRHGYELANEDGESIGVVTSGTMSPTLGEPIGLGYVETAYAEDGERIRVVVRGDTKQATITTPPFLEGY